MLLRRIFFGMVLTLPVFMYLLAIHANALNMPWMDDFSIFMGYLNQPFPERYGLLLLQHNEHKVLVARLVAEVYYAITGRVNFIHLIYAGNGFLLFLTGLLFYVWKRSPVSTGFFMPVPYLIFVALSWESMIMASSALNHLPVVPFVLLALILYDRKTPASPFLCMLSAALGAFSSGAGLVMIVILMCRVFSTASRETFTSRDHYERNRLIIVSVGSLLIFYLYFFNFITISQGSILERIFNLPQNILYFFTFMGNYLGIPVLAVFAGLFSVSFFLYLTYRRYDCKNPTVYFLMVYAIGCALLITLSRAHYGPGQAMSSRYVIISILFLICAYMAFLEVIVPHRLLNRKAQYVFLFLAFVFCINSHKVIAAPVSHYRNAILSSMESWARDGTGLFYPHRYKVNPIFQKALDKGYFRVPEVPDTP